MNFKDYFIQFTLSAVCLPENCCLIRRTWSRKGKFCDGKRLKSWCAQMQVFVCNMMIYERANENGCRCSKLDKTEAHLSDNKFIGWERWISKQASEMYSPTWFLICIVLYCVHIEQTNERTKSTHNAPQLLKRDS